MGAPTLHEAIVESLAKRIVFGQVPPGSSLSLAQVQEEFGVSRTVARDVMRVLESFGVVESRRKVGIVVLPASSWSVLDPRVIRWRMAGPGRQEQVRALTELRLGIEPMAAASAALNATPEQKAELGATARTLARLADASTVREYLDADIRFHQLLLEASRNEFFAALGETLAAALSARTEFGMMPSHAYPSSIAAHLEVSRSVDAGDSDAAFDASARMLAELRHELLADAGAETLTAGAR
ncbi:FCD domain-containing protein [Brooklawnia cerclae]|uniref:DNA-binding FadR family transcriptional regulator n=1 Tax=Brooklawnia cerclae TaxID=349934 RepID=A0ABX0SLI9_9ACTN|nr:FCD domain-containing protein [Brooklawnia cerclae]NIH57621.1 DNA-binding FadR family transcriptional regulator [Brooklawnia cerclae]